MVPSQMADLRAEVGVLARTADILQNQYNEVKQTIVSKYIFRSNVVNVQNFDFIKRCCPFISLTYSETYFHTLRANLMLKLLAFLGQTRGNQ